MSKANPLSSRCTATAKTTGERCIKWVVGGGVCYFHGGAAPQVVAKREARIIALEAAQRQEPIEVRDPAEALLGAAALADELLQRLHAELRQGGLEPATLAAVGEWADRVGRLSKAVLDARLDERAARVAEGRGREIAGVIRRILNALDLSDVQWAAVPEIVPRELRSFEAKELPSTTVNPDGRIVSGVVVG
jgi:hypothetical protein